MTSSVYYPQSNGEAERMVQTVKGFLKKSVAVLVYRATPMPWCGLSPSELCMGRRLRTTIPQTKLQLTPTWSYLPEFRGANKKLKARQKKDFENRHRVREYPDIPDNSEVCVRTGGQTVEGQVVRPAETPRSYIVETPTGEVCRNRSQIIVTPSGNESRNEQSCNKQSEIEPQRTVTTRS